VPWVEVFAVLLVSHLAGDYVLQSDWQAQHKTGGLGGDRESRRALLSHIASYTLAFVPALVWLWDSLGAGVLGVAVLIAGPHLIQDDGRVLMEYMHRVKKAPAEPGDPLFQAVDQSFHILALFAVSLVAGT
jgi:Protein of unknown function (DUF3307)